MSAVLRALSVSAPAVLLEVPAAIAEPVRPSTLPAEIPAQPLAQALAAFARQTDLQLVYVSGIVINHKSRAVPRGLAVNEALTRLLQGTGLRFEYLTPETIRIMSAAPSVEIPAQASMQEEPFAVTISANRLQQNVQDVPITIQTVSGERMKELSLTTFDALLRYMPSVTYSSNGPATGNIFMRGLGFVGTGNQSQATTAPFPSVALYLDDQSMQFPSRNNDVYLVDMERVEVLEGPQSTLFGGGAEAGLIRYVTNKPKLDVTAAEASAGYGTTARGDSNNVLSAVLNLPLIADRLAMRGVIFSERQGGYIANVPSTIGFQPGTTEATTGVNANNAYLVASNTNPVYYQGLRLSLLWKFHDRWDLLLQQNYQAVEADGYFYAYPYDSNGTALRPYQITAFTPAFTKDRYQSTAWKIAGEPGPLSAVYTGSFMVRHIEGQQDYSNYLRSSLGSSYYSCIGAGAGYFNDLTFPTLAGKPLACYPPVGNWHDAVENQHQSHELRISTPANERLRGVFGGFWEKFVIFDQMDFNYLTIPQCDPANLAAAEAGGPACLSAVGPEPGSFANDPSLRVNMNDAFGEDLQRGYKQLAFFASVDFDLIPKVVTLSAGTRHYRYDEFEYGSEWYTATSSPLILNNPNGACTRAGPGPCGFPISLSKDESGFSSRGSLTWHPTPAVMAFYTYSQGFRPGGFNRTRSVPGLQPILPREAPYCGAASTDPRCLPGGDLYGLPTHQYARQMGYNSDTLVNHELGVKSELLDHRLLMNASTYWMRWNDVQSQLFDPAHLGNGTWIEQGPSYTIKGVALQLVARITPGLTLQGSGSWNSSSQSGAPCLRSVGMTLTTPNNPTPLGQCISVVKGLPYTNPWEPAGSSLPYSPASQFSLQVRYEWSTNVFRPFVTAGASHIGSMHTSPQNFPDGNDPGQTPPTTSLLRYTIPGYTLYDGTIGVRRDRWTVQVTGSNLTNAYGPANITSAQFIRAEIPLRPRVVMAQLGYAF